MRRSLYLCDVCDRKLGPNDISITGGLRLIGPEGGQPVVVLGPGDYCHGCFVKALQPHIKGLYIMQPRGV